MSKLYRDSKNLAIATNCYDTDYELYVFASKFWDGKLNAISCSRALRLAMNEPNCPKSIDPFESLVDHEPSLYAKADVCGQVWDKEKKIYVDA